MSNFACACPASGDSNNLVEVGIIITVEQSIEPVRSKEFQESDSTLR